MLEKIKVAIISSRDFPNYSDDNIKIIDNITDWEEISYEDYQYLCRGMANLSSHRHGFQVVAKPNAEDQHDIIIRSVAEGQKLIKEWEEKEQKKKQERLERKKEKQKRLAEEEKEQYERLKAKFEVEEQKED